jgi:lysophospholipase L1-like esterase
VVIYSTDSKNNLLILITERGLIMKKGMKSILTPVLVASFMAMSATPAMAATTPKTIDYVAFGDSVAAGVRGGNADPRDPAYELGSAYGYTDNIANKLREAGVLGSFNEQFAISGATAAGLALASNILNYPAPPEINPVYNLVKNAEIMTLDIGANDLLGPLYEYVATHSDIQYDNSTQMAEVVNILNGIMGGHYFGSTGAAVQGNIETILKNILNVNPSVKIYVMGYYNPLPALSAANNMDLQVNAAMNYFNTFIETATKKITDANEGASINYVDTMAAMAKNSDKNLVPTDIHPTEAGYRVIAKEFWSQVKLNLRNAE